MTELNVEQMGALLARGYHIISVKVNGQWHYIWPEPLEEKVFELYTQWVNAPIGEGEIGHNSGKIENNLWNEKAGAYTDRGRFNGTFSDVLTPASFMPLFIRSASVDRAKKMAELAENKDKFDCLMPTVSFDNPAYSTDYWRGPMWLNTAYFAAKGLKNYNFPVADKIKDNVLSLVYDVGNIRENYDCKNRKGLSCQDFSWSAVFVIEFLLNFN